MGTVNVTVRFNEEELRKLDELAQRMGKTRSDVIRSLINNFDEALRQEVEKERKKWILIGFMAALESVILDPEVIVRFVRRNVDVLGYPDFLIGMVKVRNRTVLFSHQDKIGNQLLQLVRSKVEDEVRKEEMEIEREEDDEGDVGGGRSAPAYVHVSKPARPNTIRVAPGIPRYKIVISNKSVASIPRPTATTTMGKPVINNGGSGAKSTASTTAPGSKKLAGEELTAGAGSANAQPISSNQRASTNGSGKGLADSAGQGINHKVGGDFVTALITQSYHKHRDRLLKLMESIMGE